MCIGINNLGAWVWKWKSINWVLIINLVLCSETRNFWWFIKRVLSPYGGARNIFSMTPKQILLKLGGPVSSDFYKIQYILSWNFKKIGIRVPEASRAILISPPLGVYLFSLFLAVLKDLFSYKEFLRTLTAVIVLHFHFFCFYKFCFNLVCFWKVFRKDEISLDKVNCRWT